MEFTPLPERDDVTPDVFRNEIMPAGQPVVMRGLVEGWSLTQAASDPDALLGLLRNSAGDAPVSVSRIPGAARGRFFYQDDMRKLNFEMRRVPMAVFLDRLRSGVTNETLYMGSSPVSTCAPGLADALPLPLIPDGTEPRLWIGNPTVVSTHHDASSNIACVAAGERTFTLFPPEQLRNLYPGPMEHTPAGPQLSLVDISAPDLERYPRFANALKTARAATLRPGDAIFIPPLWWHDVRAHSPINVLVNFWWRHRPEAVTSVEREPIEAFVLSLLALRQLPEPEREAWRAMFDYFIFKTDGEPMAHLPDEYRGVLGPIDPARAGQIWKFFQDMMPKS